MRTKKICINTLLIIVTIILATIASCKKDVAKINVNNVNNVINCDPFTDSRDGNSYQVVQIGDQCWMAENLKYLPSVVGPGTGSETTPYYYVYEYYGTDINAAKANSYYNTYGVLYNWRAAINGTSSSNSNPSGINGICPSGWHLPSDAEWCELEMALGMEENQANSFGYRGTNEGSKLADNETLWEPGYLSFNIDFGKSEFCALPGGQRDIYNLFSTIGELGLFWSSSETSSLGIFRSISYNNPKANRFMINYDSGFSVRCVKD